MKKNILFIFALCCILTTLGCSHCSTDNWQTIHISESGTLKIPEDWYMFEKDDRIYIMDANNLPVMIETHSYCGVDDGDSGDTESNAYFEDVTNIKYLNSAVLSNGAEYGEVLVSYDNVETPKYFLSIGYDRVVEFVVWDETIDEKMLHRIAETFTVELSTD